MVYVCAFAMPAGTSMLDVLGGQPREWWIFAEEGESIMPDNPGALLFSECAPAVANGAIAGLRPHSARSVREPLHAAGYGEKPATYVICERDAILPANVAERVAALAQATTISLDSDQHPMLGRPAEPAPYPGWNRRANRPRRTGRVLIRRFVLTGRAGVDARGQARYGADLQGVGDSWRGTG